MTNYYLLLKSLHLLGVVMFLGNIIITGWWKYMADKTRHPVVIGFAQRQVTLTDWVFTAGGGLLVLLGGFGNVTYHGIDWQHITWLSWGYWLFIISGILWVTILIPVQIKQARLARAFENGGDIPDEYWRLGHIWIGVGTVATILPLLNLYWMVFKPV